MTKETKQAKDLRASIALHEQALKDMQAKADAADGKLSAHKQKVASDLLRFRRPGQAGVVFTEPDKERERLEAERVRLSAEVYRFEKKIEWLRGLLRAELQKA